MIDCVRKLCHETIIMERDNIGHIQSSCQISDQAIDYFSTLEKLKGRKG